MPSCDGVGGNCNCSSRECEVVYRDRVKEKIVYILETDEERADRLVKEARKEEEMRERERGAHREHLRAIKQKLVNECRKIGLNIDDLEVS